MPYPGQPQDTAIPPKLDRWNWGAFLLNWIWGIGNSTYIAFLMFVPLVNLIMMFVLGAKGSKWAWKNRVWADEDHFVRTQRNWARAGFVVVALAVAFCGLLVYGVFSFLKGSEAYKMTMARVENDQQVISALGQPIEAAWFVTGNVHVSLAQGGSANLSIPVSGPKGSATVISRATKTGGVWELTLVVVRVDGNPTPIILVNKNNIQIPNAAQDT